MPAKKYFEKDQIYTYLFVALFLGLSLLALWVAKPFISAILVSVVIAYFFYPVYSWLNKRIKRKKICAALVSLLIVLIILVPLFLIIDTAAPDARFAYIRAKQKILTGEFIDVKCPEGTDSLLCKFTGWTQKAVQDPDMQFYLQDIVGRITDIALKTASDMVLALPMILLNIFVTFFVVFFLLMDGKELAEKIKRLLPVKRIHQEHIFQKLNETTHAVIYGSLAIALLQGLLGGLGFWFFGVSSPVLWGFVMAVFALVPFIGTGIIWAPAGIILILEGSSIGNPALVWKGIGLLIYGIVIVSSADNVLKPWLIGGRAKIHPVLILIGVLGGLAVFGLAGFIIGPIVLAAFKTFLDIYQREYSEVH